MLAVFRLTGRPTRGGRIVVRSCKTCQSRIYSIQRRLGAEAEAGHAAVVELVSQLASVFIDGGCGE